MRSRLKGVIFGLLFCSCLAHGQNSVLRDWRDIRDLEAWQVTRQLPVLLEGTITFSEKSRSFLVVGEETQGIPVHVIGPYPDITKGDRVRLTGTTMFLLKEPGIRMVTLEKLKSTPPEDRSERIPPDFQASDPFFKKVAVEGLVTSIIQKENQLLLGFSPHAKDRLYLRIPRRLIDQYSFSHLIGQ